MLRFLVIGDMHFKVGNGRYTTQLQQAIANVLQQERFDYVVLLGDIMDTFEQSTGQVATRVADFICMLTLYVEHIFVLVGNHDRGKEESLFATSTTLAMLRTSRQVTLVQETLLVTLAELQFIFVPYVDPGRFEEALAHINYNSQMRIAGIFAHQEFRGVKMGAIVSEIGDPWPLTAPFCVTGHIHDAQRLQPNLYYTGTPMAHGHGEHGVKTICDLTFDDKGTVKLEVIPMHVGRKFTITKTLEQLLNYIAPANCSVRIRIIATPTAFQAILKDPRLRHLQTPDVKFKRIEPMTLIQDIVDNTSTDKFWSNLNQVVAAEDVVLRELCNEVLEMQPIQRRRLIRT